jgi:aspartate aminotransferase
MADDVRQLITDKTRLVIINSPSNPTGAMTEQKEIEEIYKICSDKGTSDWSPLIASIAAR